MCKVEQLLNSYYENNAKKLHAVINKIFNKHYGGTTGIDIEEFYGIGTDVLIDIWNKYRKGKSTYDPLKGNFDGYVYRAIYMAITDEFKKQNRDKRTTKVFLLDNNGEKVIDEKTGKPIKISLPDVRLDAPIKEDSNTTQGDMIKSDFNIDDEIERNFKDERVEKFLNNLSKTQKQIAEMIMEGVSVFVIKKKLNLSDKDYNDNLNAMRSFENISVLRNNENQTNFMEDKNMSTATQTMENCKTDRISIASIVKKIDKHTIRFDHPLQRESDQWSPSMKGNLVSDILQGNKLHPLIFAEQIINGLPIIWDLDGKQRCTNVYLYSKNGYKVSKNIRRWMIRYQTIKKDEDGNDILDENGFPVAVNAEFDIRGKKFSDLPEELRDRFLDYSFNYDQYLNCSEEDIGYHIERYNDGKTMTSPQKGIMKLGTEYAESVKSISNMPFFKDMGGYKVSEFKNGNINRVVVESIMTANYLDKWNKFDDMCRYIKQNADITIFDDFEEMVGRLEKVVTNDVSDMFNSKDSFLWFGLFARFVKSESDDQRFIEFMTEFIQSLHSKSINGIAFDDILESSNTKDKGIVTKKMNHLIQLMNEYLENKERKQEIVNSPVKFVADAIGVDKETIEEGIDVYNDDLDTLLNNTVKIGSKIRDQENRLSLLAMVAYSHKEDVDLDNWFAQYAKRDTYYTDQKVNFIHMKNDFELYLKKCA